MTGRCTICRLPAARRAAVDKALIAGETVRSVAARFVTATGKPLGRMSVYRHKDECLADVLRRAKGEADLAHAIDLVAQLKAINGVAFQILQDARRSGDAGLALRAIDRVLAQLTLVAKASGQVDDAPKVAVFLTAEWGAIHAVLMRALDDHPEARLEVVQALVELEQDGGRRD